MQLLWLQSQFSGRYYQTQVTKLRLRSRLATAFWPSSCSALSSRSSRRGQLQRLAIHLCVRAPTVIILHHGISGPSRLLPPYRRGQPDSSSNQASPSGFEVKQATMVIFSSFAHLAL
ncbi:hypothetical protein Bca4012_084633 [Brassica carinata]|uniref:Uncharacterized protein n=1 Tax=Brassica carinata TaxID=52824 RepID=A0A8X7SHB6_BRACI|nr:hypothetical protein Bca52824_026081 [Brassica carinata]